MAGSNPLEHTSAAASSSILPSSTPEEQPTMPTPPGTHGRNDQPEPVLEGEDNSDGVQNSPTQDVASPAGESDIVSHKRRLSEVNDDSVQHPSKKTQLTASTASEALLLDHQKTSKATRDQARLQQMAQRVVDKLMKLSRYLMEESFVEVDGEAGVGAIQDAVEVSCAEAIQGLGKNVEKWTKATMQAHVLSTGKPKYKDYRPQIDDGFHSDTYDKLLRMVSMLEWCDQVVDEILVDEEIRGDE